MTMRRGQHQSLLPRPVLRERAGERVSAHCGRLGLPTYPLPNPLPEYRAREQGFARAVVEALEIRQLLAQSVWAYPGTDGHLLYKTLPLGDHIQDYSTSGYKG